MIRDGETVEIAAHEDAIMIRRTRPRYTLQELFKGQSASEWRAAYAEAFAADTEAWGPDLGREVTPE